MQDYKKIDYSRNKDVVLRYIPGHFITPHSHVNYYMDLSDMKARQREARATGEEMAEPYFVSTAVDTVLCLEDMEVVGAYLANKLTKAGVLSKNAHQTIYVVAPEYDTTGQVVFRENTQHMVKNKNVIILTASVTTGSALTKAIEAVNYFGGSIVGVSAIFSAASKVMGMPIHALYTTRDLPDYHSYPTDNCPLCQAKVHVDALCNGFGFSSL
ncbi:MAG: orotate phosphoribosyltransferase [Lachnospiraceae bacterium]|nr:orotate phosphoribosyltransferase [Lachnospiraceae bacterium]